MGLAASQARFLNLTSRQHDLEHKAQFLQASKLRLANDSDKVYNKYIEALDATKLETRVTTTNNKLRWVEGSLDNLMGYSPEKVVSNNIFFAQNIHNGKIYVKNNIATAYDKAIAAGGDIYNFYDEFSSELTYEKNVYSRAYLEAKATVDNDIARGWNIEPYSTNSADKAFIQKYMELKSLVINPPKSELYDTADIIRGILNYTTTHDKTGKDIYLPAYETDLPALQKHLNTIKTLGASYVPSGSDIEKIIEFCLNFNILPDSDKENITTVTAIKDERKYLVYDKDKLMDAKAENTYITNIERLKILLNGGVYSLNENANQDVYDTTTEAAIKNYTLAGSPNIGDALKQFTDNIKIQEIDKAQTIAQANFNTFLASKGTSKEVVEKKLENYKQYLRDSNVLSSTDKGLHTEFSDARLAEYYEIIFNAIKSAGGYIVISNTNAKDGNWVHNMIKSTQVVLATYTKQDDNGTLDSITPLSSPVIREISDKKNIEQANIEYETALDDINEKERKYNIELNKLEEEHSAIQVELESLKKIAKENVERTFKLFS